MLSQRGSVCGGTALQSVSGKELKSCIFRAARMPEAEKGGAFFSDSGCDFEEADRVS